MQLGMENTYRFFTGEAGAWSFLSILSKVQYICVNGLTQLFQCVLSTQTPTLPGPSLLPSMAKPWPPHALNKGAG